MRFLFLFPVPISLCEYSSYSLWQSREKEPGILFCGVIRLLLFGVEIVEDSLAVIDFINHAVQRPHNRLGVHMAVVRHERADITERRIGGAGIMLSRQYESTKALKGRMLRYVTNGTGGRKMGMTSLSVSFRTEGCACICSRRVDAAHATGQK